MTTRLTSVAIAEILKRAAKKIGATILIEPEWGHVGQITYLSGIRRYFRLSTFDLNTTGASEIARDKGYARFFLRSMGYPVAEGQTFFAPKWAKTCQVENRGLVDAWRYAQAIGCPVFVKPNSLSRGVDVTKVQTRKEFVRAARAAMRSDKVILVEKEVKGRDYRLVMLDGQVISAYERIPLSIVGDGCSTIAELIRKKENGFVQHGRRTQIDANDARLKSNLKRLNFRIETVLDKDHKMRLLDIANLSAGGTSVEVTKVVHHDFKRLAASIAHDMGLRLVGVDLVVSGDISSPPCDDRFWVIEVNGAPGLDHYAAMGEVQKKIVDDLYLQVIRAMERPQEEIQL